MGNDTADQEFIDAVRGELPDEIVDQLDFRRLRKFTREVVLAQKPEVRRQILERNEVSINLLPFDEDGWTMLVLVPEGEPLLRLHYSRLLPGRFGLQEMTRVEE